MNKNTRRLYRFGLLFFSGLTILGVVIAVSDLAVAFKGKPATAEVQTIEEAERPSGSKYYIYGLKIVTPAIEESRVIHTSDRFLVGQQISVRLSADQSVVSLANGSEDLVVGFGMVTFCLPFIIIIRHSLRTNQRLPG